MPSDRVKSLHRVCIVVNYSHLHTPGLFSDYPERHVKCGNHQLSKAFGPEIIEKTSRRKELLSFFMEKNSMTTFGLCHGCGLPTQLIQNKRIEVGGVFFCGRIQP